jgi:hypothetical protein
MITKTLEGIEADLGSLPLLVRQYVKNVAAAFVLQKPAETDNIVPISTGVTTVPEISTANKELYRQLFHLQGSSTRHSVHLVGNEVWSGSVDFLRSVYASDNWSGLGEVQIVFCDLSKEEGDTVSSLLQKMWAQVNAACTLKKTAVYVV